MARQTNRRRALVLTRTLAITMCLMLAGATFVMAEPPPEDPVAVVGLKGTYTSCEIVTFSVKNISPDPIYFEVFAEKSESGSWTYVDYAYDLRDLRSLYIKRIQVHPKLLEPGASESLRWDRCMRPEFVKETDKGFKRSILQKDLRAGAPVLQRIRVDVYPHGEIRLDPQQRICSTPFKREPNAEIRASPDR